MVLGHWQQQRWWEMIETCSEKWHQNSSRAVECTLARTACQVWEPYHPRCWSWPSKYKSTGEPSCSSTFTEKVNAFKCNVADLVHISPRLQDSSIGPRRTRVKPNIHSVSASINTKSKQSQIWQSPDPICCSGTPNTVRPRATSAFLVFIGGTAILFRKQVCNFKLKPQSFQSHLLSLCELLLGSEPCVASFFLHNAPDLTYIYIYIYLFKNTHHQKTKYLSCFTKVQKALDQKSRNETWLMTSALRRGSPLSLR